MKKIIPMVIILGFAAYFLPMLLVKISLFFDRPEIIISNEEDNKDIIFPPVFDETAKATNSAKFKLSGYSQEENEVEIFINNIAKEKVKTKSGGRFEMEVKLYEGENIIFAVSHSREKAKSAKSKEILILYKKTKPKLIIEKPSEENSRSKERKIQIIGMTDSEVTVRINGRWVLIKNDGSFVFETNLNDNENKFEITAEDSAGNSETVFRTVAYTPN